MLSLLFSHCWLAMPQLVLQADWQEVWHSPQPPFLALSHRLRVLSVLICSITASGIILSTANKEKPVISEVVAVGPGDKDTEMVVKAGDKVVVGKYTGTEIKLDGMDYTIVKQSDILAIVE